MAQFCRLPKKEMQDYVSQGKESYSIMQDSNLVSQGNVREEKGQQGHQSKKKFYEDKKP